MYQRHEQREHRPGMTGGRGNAGEDNYNDRRDFSDYDEQQQQHHHQNPQNYYGNNRQFSSSNDEHHRQQPMDSAERARMYREFGSPNSLHRNQDEFNPNWTTRGGATEHRYNSSGQGDIDAPRRWNSGNAETRFETDQQNQQWSSSANSGMDAGNGFRRRYQTTGEYSGLGPKGYSRSDQRIEEDVNEHLTAHPRLDASEIQVQVKDGAVTLTGSVRSKECKRTAEDIAEDVPGVKDVQNQLRVQASAFSNVPDGNAQRGNMANASGGNNNKERSDRSRAH